MTRPTTTSSRVVKKIHLSTPTRLAMDSWFHGWVVEIRRRGRVGIKVIKFRSLIPEDCHPERSRGICSGLCIGSLDHALHHREGAICAHSFSSWMNASIRPISLRARRESYISVLQETC